MTKAALTALVVASALGMPALAQTQAVPSLSLAAAQAEARMRAPEVAEAQAVVAGAEAVAAQARRVFRDDPQISGSLFEGALIGRPDERFQTLGFSQLFDVSGSWKPRSASAGADLSRARFDGADRLRALDEQVAVSVADLALAQRDVARGERLADLQRIAAEAAQRQFEVGTAPQIDADAAALDLAGGLQAVEIARGDLDRARVRLARLLGRETGADLVVEDPMEVSELAPPPDFTPFIDADPRVRAAGAELDAARFERQTFERLVTPPLNVGVDYGRKRSDIPTGSFTGVPFASGLSANWPDQELTFNVSLPLPLFNRQLEPRARATARILTAEARLRATRADVRSELETTWALLQAASRALQAVAPTSGVVDRDVTFVEQAVRAGQFDATTRTLALRRLEESGRRVDAAVRDYRAARAAWIRRTSVTPP